MSEKIQLVSLDKIIQKSAETDILDKILCEKFFKWLNEKGYNNSKLCNLFNNGKNNEEDIVNFNKMLREAKQELDIQISSILIYFEEFFTKFRKMSSLLDIDVKQIIKEELNDRYRFHKYTTCFNEM